MIGFAGLSHLGIVSSAAAAAKGFEVAGYDPDASICAALAESKPPVAEPGLEDLLRQVAPRLRYSADPSVLAACDVIFISVDVPTDAADRSDTTPVEMFLRAAARAAKRGAILVVLSQVSPGFSRRLRPEIESYEGKGLRLEYQVETLVFGLAIERALSPERFIVGCAEPADPLPQALAAFLNAFECPILPMRYESAELAKMAINHFLAASVAMTNTLAEICEVIGADWSEIAPALRLDRRIGPHAYLTPGLGVAGGNIPRDLVSSTALAEEHGTDAGLIHAIFANSRHRRDWALRELRRGLPGGVPPPQIALWGLAYKIDTASTKNSPALALVEALQDAPIHAYDPRARVNGSYANLHVAGSPLEACREADALVVMTPWKEFTGVDAGDLRRVMRGRLIIDPFGALDGARCVAEGFSYRRLGRSASA